MQHLLPTILQFLHIYALVVAVAAAIAVLHHPNVLALAVAHTPRVEHGLPVLHHPNVLALVVAVAAAFAVAGTGPSQLHI